MAARRINWLAEAAKIVETTQDRWAEAEMHRMTYCCPCMSTRRRRTRELYDREQHDRQRNSAKSAAAALARREAGEALVEIGRSYNVSHSTISRL